MIAHLCWQWAERREQTRTETDSNQASRAVQGAGQDMQSSWGRAGASCATCKGRKGKVYEQGQAAAAMSGAVMLRLWASEGQRLVSSRKERHRAELRVSNCVEQNNKPDNIIKYELFIIGLYSSHKLTYDTF